MVKNEPTLQIDAMLAYYFKIDPDELSDEEYCLRFSQLKWVLKEESKKWQQKK